MRRRTPRLMSDEPAATSPTPAAVRELYGEALGTIEAYVSLLGTIGVEWGLIGPREVPRLWERHVLNSVAIAGLIASGATVADVGSGAGLPGIPLAVLRPDLDVVLLEPKVRRADFLTQTVDELGLGDRVRVVRARAEDEVAASRRELGKVGAVATVVSARAHEEAEPTYVVRVRRKPGGGF